MTPPRHRPATRRLLGALVLALCLAQWLALTHAVEHPQVAALAAAHGEEPHAAHAGAHVDHADHADHAEHGTDHGWNHAAGSAHCLLVDQLLSGQAPGAAPLPLADAAHASVAPLAPTASIRPGPAAWAWNARGPPAA